MISSLMTVYLVLYLNSFLLVINCDDWFLMWLGMEINMLSFLFLIFIRNSMENIESCFKYFFIQSMGSALLISFFYLNKYMFMYMGSLILSYKMGGGPFFFWFPSVCSGLNWMGCFFLMSFQKFIPLLLMVFFSSWIIWWLMGVSLIVGGVGCMNQKNIKRLMAYSSIHHIGWILFCVLIESNLWIIYMALYMMIILPVVIMLSMFEINSVNMMVKWGGKWSFIMMLLSMGGMPPFLGFFLKWMIFYYILKMSLSMIILMIILSVLMFYIYIRMVYDMFMGSKEDMGWTGKNIVKKYFYSVDMIVILGGVLGCSVGIILMV